MRQWCGLQVRSDIRRELNAKLRTDKSEQLNRLVAGYLANVGNAIAR